MDDRSKLTEMAKVIDEVIAHYHEYDVLDEPWLIETARQLRAMAHETHTPKEGSLSAALLAEVANGQAADLRAARARIRELETS